MWWFKVRDRRARIHESFHQLQESSRWNGTGTFILLQESSTSVDEGFPFVLKTRLQGEEERTQFGDTDTQFNYFMQSSQTQRR